MFGSFLKTKGTLQALEIEDKKINKQLATHLKAIKKTMNMFKEYIRQGAPFIKDKYYQNLVDELNESLHLLTLLRRHVEEVQSIEQQYQHLIVIQDKEYLQEKYEQITMMYRELDYLKQLMQARPSAQELEHEFIEKIEHLLYDLEVHLDKLLTIDEQLRTIYTKLHKL